MEHKKFMDIERIKEGYVTGFNKGDFIYIEEKVDGANAAIRYDVTTNSIVAQSRKQILTPANNLRGFFEFTQRLDVDKVHEVLGENLIAYGEYLCPHTVKYPDDKYNNFYMYDVYDLETQSYLPQEKVVTIAENLGLTIVPIFYVGEFISWEHCMSFVGKSELGAESGEGIVVKNQTRLNDSDYRHPFYLKIVGEKFCETKAHGHIKQTNPDVLAKLEADRELAETIVTEARVTKILHKMVDEGIIPADWGSRDMGTIAKNLPRLVYEDCVKEESETVNAINNFGKIANSIAMGVVRNKL